MMTDNSLIKRLQEAESGSRELDTLVWCAANPGLRIFDEEWPGVCVDADGVPVIATSVSTSLDAIVALIGEKLPGWGVVIRMERKPYLETCELCAPDDPNASLMDKWPVRMSGGAKTAPLACCIALLTAIQSQGEGKP